MTNRERAMNLLHFKPADRLPAVHFGYWNELLAEWAEQGKISKELADNWGDGNEADAEIDKLSVGISTGSEQYVVTYASTLNLKQKFSKHFLTELKEFRMETE